MPKGQINTGYRGPEPKVWTPSGPRLAREEMEDIQQRLNPPQKIDPYSQSIPLPDSFNIDPPVVGNQEFSRTAQKFLAQYPRLRKQISSMIQGPTSGSMKTMIRSGMPVDAFQGTNLMGVYDRKTKSIGLNPDLESNRIEDIMYHEATHAQGGDEDEAQDIARRAKALRALKRKDK